MRIFFISSNLTIRNTIYRVKKLLILNEYEMIGSNLDDGKNPAIKQRNLSNFSPRILVIRTDR